MQTPRRSPNRRSVIIASVAVTALLLTAAAMVFVVGKTDAASLATAEAKAAAFTAIQDQYLALGSNDLADTDRLFAGPARDEMRQLRGHIRQLIAAGTDYPGRITLSNVQVLSIAGDYSTAMTIDFVAHVRLANMKGGRTVDYSEADEICHVVVVRDDGTWKVSEIRWQFAPGSGP